MKTCKNCGETKPLQEFYSQPSSKDGRFSKCKSCIRVYDAARLAENKKNPEWVEKELIRHRKAAAKSAANGYKSKRHEKGYEKWLKKNPDKRKAHNMVGNAIKSGKLIKCPCEICGEIKSEAHHDDYSKPLNVRWFCKKHHHDHHVELRRLERFSKYKIEEKL